MAFKMRYGNDGPPMMDKSFAKYTSHNKKITGKGNALVNKNNNEANDKNLEERVIEKESSGTSPKKPIEKLKIPTVPPTVIKPK